MRGRPQQAQDTRPAVLVERNTAKSAEVVVEPLVAPPAQRDAPLRATTAGGVGTELLLIALAAAAYVGIRAVTEGRTDVAERNAYELMRLQQALDLAWEEWIQSLVVGREWAVAACNWIYIYGHWPVIATVAVLLFRTRRERYRLLRNAVFLSGAIGFLCFAFLPVAPPRLLELGLVDTVAERSASNRALQPPELTNQPWRRSSTSRPPSSTRADGMTAPRLGARSCDATSKSSTA